uniref:Uncharacterized protein n=1 Tax=viral metagenome TaxID=1070528 RepID=A0A6C0LI38_9ZZZZ
MGLFGVKKSNENIKLDDYIDNKISNLKKLVKDNKTLITFTILGCTYYFVKTNFLV